MRTRHLLPTIVLAGAMLSASAAQAVDLIFTGRITSGVDNGALFGPVGASLVGQAITIDFSFAPVDPGTTGVEEFIGATITMGTHSIDASDNDHSTSAALVSGPPDEVSAYTSQTFALGFSDASAQVKSSKSFVPAGADLNSAFSYHVKPGDTANGFFNIANDGFPDDNLPPFGGPGSSTPWENRLLFSVNAVYLNTPVAAPEPASWAMLLAGFAGVGAALRGRRTSRLGRIA